MSKINQERLGKITKAAFKRQPDFTVVLENIHDGHNIGAVLRSADAVGLQEVYVLNSDPALGKPTMKLGKRTSSGARKWLDIQLYRSVDACFEALRKKYDHIIAASVQPSGKSLYELDLTAPTALVFGNEHAGISTETLAQCTGAFTIPQMGMTQSLNISVACAVSLFEGLRQRDIADFYQSHPRHGDEAKAIILDDYLERHASGYKAFKVTAKD